MALHNPPHPGEFLQEIYLEPGTISIRELAGIARPPRPVVEETTTGSFRAPSPRVVARLNSDIAAALVERQVGATGDQGLQLWAARSSNFSTARDWIWAVVPPVSGPQRRLRRRSDVTPVYGY